MAVERCETCRHSSPVDYLSERVGYRCAKRAEHILLAVCNIGQHEPRITPSPIPAAGIKPLGENTS